MANQDKPNPAINRGSTLTVRTKLQGQLIWMICASILVPTLILGGALWLLVTRISSPHTEVLPQEVVVDVMRYVALLFPLAMSILLYWTFRGTNQIVGPIERMTRELEKRVGGESRGPIVLRPGDQLVPLADAINILLEERQKYSGNKKLESAA